MVGEIVMGIAVAGIQDIYISVVIDVVVVVVSVSRGLLGSCCSSVEVDQSDRETGRVRAAHFPHGRRQKSNPRLQVLQPTGFFVRLE